MPVSECKKNAPDPFWLLCAANLYGITKASDLASIQATASISTGISSAVGNFHQKVLGKIDGFRNHDASYDVECIGRRILAEIKNKHNTMNADNRAAVEDKLKKVIASKPDYDGYLVIVVPKKPTRYTKQIATRLQEVDGATFYELATGVPTALHDLYADLATRLCANAPNVMKHVTDEYLKSLPK